MKVSAVLSGHASALRRLTLMTLLAGAAAWPAAPAAARSPHQAYSRTLRGQFVLDHFHFPGYGRQWAVAVKYLDDDSPLHRAGVRPGDIITRLDNIRVSNLERLERHYCWTTVRFFQPRNANPWDDGGKTCYQREIHIPNGGCRCQ